MLDIGKDMDKLTGHEKLFYHDQKSMRECRLSEDIDEEFEEGRQAVIAMELDSEQEENAEYSFMMGEGEDLNNTSYDEFNSSSVSYSNTSLNQSINYNK